MRLFACVLLTVFVIVFSLTSFAQIGISVTFGPPALPVYEQPPCPAEGYIWTPGYWAYDYDYDDYYWVPGTWVLAPEPGFFWTPPYWAWNGASFIFYDGYWGPQVGFYGGINYGYGYFGNGYEGGRWEGGRFFYNRSVNNINVTNITNVYNTTVVNQTTVNRVSYNGGPGGISARPTPQQESYARERHVGPVGAQIQHVQAARSDPQLRASRNEGRPPIAATPRPGEFRGGGVVQAREAGAPYRPPANRGARGVPARGNEPAPRPENNAGRGFENVPRPGNNARPTHPSELPPLERPAPRDTGNAKADQKYQRQQEKLYSQQQQERQKLQQRQDQEHQKLARQNADQARQQQVEQRHQQQTQQLQQRQQQRQQKVQGPPRGNERREPPR
jgi:hypothetical protein